MVNNLYAYLKILKILIRTIVLLTEKIAMSMLGESFYAYVVGFKVSVF